MKRLVALLGFALFLLLPTSVSAADCQFVLGFATLRDLVGHEIVGECLENEHHNEIGDSVQQTTGGLLVWRKADNWTAFTDGYRTWINGPNGLEQRLNTQRFAWEGDRSPVTSILSSAPPPDPAPAPARSLLELILASPWYQDGVDHSDKYQAEPIGLRALVSIDRNSPQLAKEMSRWAWVFDGDMNLNEAYAVYALDSVAKNAPKVAHHLTTLPWIQDGIDNGEMGALFHLGGFAARGDQQFALELATLPWVVDGVTYLESSQGLAGINTTTSPPQRRRYSILEARRVLSFVNYPPTEVDFYLLRALSFIQDKHSGGLSRLYSAPWVADGLDQFERIYLIAAAGSNVDAEQLFAPYHIASARISLPHSGVVTLWTVRRHPFHPGDPVLQNLEEAVRASERFWGIPFPVDHVILSLLNPGSGGANRGYMLALGNYGGTLTSAPYHVVAHYYFHSGPTWFENGGASVVELYAVNGGEIPEVPFPKNCRDRGVQNLQAIHERGGGPELGSCRHSLGVHFLVALRETMGAEAWLSALREIYTIFGYRGLYVGSWSTQPTEEDLYTVFLKHTPPHLVEAVKDVFRRLHGGPLVD